MPRVADVLVAGQPVVAHWNGAGTNYIVETPSGNLYMVYNDSGSDVMYKKSTDGGLSWGTAVSVFTGTTVALSIWYDRWSNIAADRIHMAYTESGGSDTLYRTLNTADDSLSTQTTIFAGASQASGKCLSISRAVGGNVYCKTMIDAGAEGGFYRLLNANVPNGAWDAARTVDETLATTDQMILLPDFDAADNQDMLAIFWDASADEVSRKLYDDSGNSWSETSIATSMVDQVATTAFPHFAVAPDISNTNHILVAWSGVDTLNADLRCWTVDSGAITAKTDVVTNSTDDQGLCAVTLDLNTGWWYVFYAGITSGGETYSTALNIYYKVSKDQGSTWGAETKLSVLPTTVAPKWMASIPRAYRSPLRLAYYHDTTIDELRLLLDHTVPHANYQIGI
jgi:hypothetical protein